MRKLIVCGIGLVAALALTVPGAFGGAAQTPGLTAKTVTIGGTFPLTGPAAAYAPIPVGMKAYFSYINARRLNGQRGVNGRQIVWKYYDDAYNPANTVQLTRRLVEQDRVFATVGQLGTEHNLAVRGYLNQQRVPQSLVSTGAANWGLETKEYPWTTGWQPDYIAEGRIYGLHIKANHNGKKIAVLYQNDDYGKNYLLGLRSALGKTYSDANIAAEVPFEVTATSLASQMTRIRASGATIFVLLATPTPTIRAYATGRALGFNPEQIYLNSVSATAAFLNVAVANAGANVRERLALGRVPQGPGQPAVEQRSGDEAVPPDHGQVRAERRREQRSLLLRRGEGRGVRPGPHGRREEPDPGELPGAADEDGQRQPVRTSGRPPEDVREGPLHHQPDAADPIHAPGLAAPGTAHRGAPSVTPLLRVTGTRGRETGL